MQVQSLAVDQLQPWFKRCRGAVHTSAALPFVHMQLARGFHHYLLCRSASTPAILHLFNVQGAVMVTLKKGEDLPSADPNGYSDPYVKFKLNGNSKKSTIKRFTINPAWNEKFEWFRVRYVIGH